jgi:hypothetical protein
MIISHPTLKPAAKVVLVAISRKFNTEYYEETGELFAWPKRETLAALTNLTVETVRASIKEAEACGVLFIEHGRRRGQRQDVNRYFARWPQGQNFCPWPWPQGQNFDGRKFCLEEKIMNKSRESKRVEKKEDSQQQNFCPSDKKERLTPDQAADLRPEGGESGKRVFRLGFQIFIFKHPLPRCSARPPSPKEGEDRLRQLSLVATMAVRVRSNWPEIRARPRPPMGDGRSG